MKWFADTLFKRLFVLMWAALVGSHLVAYGVATQRFFGGGAPVSLSNLPTFPSLPPTPGLPDPPRAGPGGPPPPPPGRREGPGGPPPPAGDHAQGRPGMPADMLVLDYGVRFLIIGLAAWWGARWLSAPMRRLARAATALGRALGRSDAPPQLDDERGTVEVRETARVFNEMASALGEQFKSRGLLVAAISHDLRTPLTRIRMRLESMEDNPAAQRCIGDLREMNELIDSVLQVFRDSTAAEPPQRTEVFALVQSLADDLVEQGHAVALEGGPTVALAQPAALRRVLANLLGNAVRYGERATVTVGLDGDGVRIVIDDDGPGIPEAQLEAVFQPFYRVESSRNRDTGGTGLGLYIARDLALRQGGRLTLSNRPQGGLRAEVVLPRP
jgi:signal transduction histidine kinase